MANNNSSNGGGSAAAMPEITATVVTPSAAAATAKGKASASAKATGTKVKPSTSPKGSATGGPTASAAAKPAISDPSGVAMPVGNIAGWREVFTDDFTEQVPIGKFPAAVSSKWTAYDAGWLDTTHNGVYEPGKVVSIHDGMMDLYLHTENGVHMVAAPEALIPGATGQRGGMVYGRYEVRFKADPVVGYKTAWLLWPDSNVWTDGEIDYPEGDLNSYFGANLHVVGNPETAESFPTYGTYGSWHTATIEWTANSVICLLDGQVVATSKDKSVVPTTAMHWVLQTETTLDGPAPTDAAAGHVYIDWVAVYVPQS